MSRNKYTVRFYDFTRLLLSTFEKYVINKFSSTFEFSDIITKWLSEEIFQITSESPSVVVLHNKNVARQFGEVTRLNEN